MMNKLDMAHTICAHFRHGKGPQGKAREIALRWAHLCPDYPSAMNRIILEQRDARAKGDLTGSASVKALAKALMGVLEALDKANDAHLAYMAMVPSCPTCKRTPNASHRCS